MTVESLATDFEKRGLVALCEFVESEPIDCLLTLHMAMFIHGIPLTFSGKIGERLASAISKIEKR